MKYGFVVLMGLLGMQFAQAQVVIPKNDLSDGAKVAIVTSLTEVLKNKDYKDQFDCVTRAQSIPMYAYKIEDKGYYGSSELAVSLIGQSLDQMSMVKAEMSITNFDVYHTDRYEVTRFKCGIYSVSEIKP